MSAGVGSSPEPMSASLDFKVCVCAPVDVEDVVDGVDVRVVDDVVSTATVSLPQNTIMAHMIKIRLTMTNTDMLFRRVKFNESSIKF
jgi:hypothetical protein